jgi:hypothetical protein
MKNTKTIILITVLLFANTSIITQADEVAQGAFWGASSGAIIGGAAGGGRGAGIGAGVGLGLGILSGGVAKSRRKKREKSYRSLRNEEYAHEEIMPDGDLENDEKNIKTKTPKKIANNQTVDSSTEDDEYIDEEVLPVE